MVAYGKKSAALLSSVVLAASLFLTGCGEEQAPPQSKASVKAMKVMKQDTPVSYAYPGQLEGTDEVEVHARVSGSVMEKYFQGGAEVHAGQPLYRLDSRQYESALIEAQASLHKSQATLRNAQEDLARDEMLWAKKAVSEQTLTSQRATVAEYEAEVESERAAVRKAQENLDDTIVYAPMDGRLSVDDVAVGTYATAGGTTLVTLGSIDPIYAKFSISETEYLNLLAKAMEKGGDSNASDEPMPKVKITLSNGQVYPLEGDIIAADKGFSNNSGSLTVKALFPNPHGVMLSGMFVRVGLVGVTAKDAILVPQRAVQQLLDETFVLVVGDDGKSVSKKVELGEKVGSYYIVKKGVTTDDTVIVDGLTNLQSGRELDVTMVTAEDMGFSLTESADIVDKS